YPKMYEDYMQKCECSIIRIGKVDYFEDESGMIIINFPTKNHFKYPSRIEWIEMGLKDFSNSYKDHLLKSVAFPKLGTSKGGLNWEQVKPLMEKYLEPLELDITICLDETKEAEGIEKIMLDMFNDTNVDEMSSITRLNSKQKEAIKNKQPYRRFWAIEKTEGIGKKTYKALFEHYYLKAKKGNEYEQISFDFG
ncbi:MAG: macro domain-containing protein, partial [Mogibacterium sp.]|nr:macro domain-containing protein [Mogibacterium sp.]